MSQAVVSSCLSYVLSFAWKTYLHSSFVEFLKYETLGTVNKVVFFLIFVLIFFLKMLASLVAIDVNNSLYLDSMMFVIAGEHKTLCLHNLWSFEIQPRCLSFESLEAFWFFHGTLQE